MTKRKTIGRYFRKIDLFSTDISFRENKGNSFGSNFGAFLSLIVFFIIGMYGNKKLSILVNKEDTKIMDYLV